MEGDRDSEAVIEEKQDQEVVGEQDEAKKMEEELEKKAEQMQERRERKKMFEDCVKNMDEELEKAARRMQEKRKGKEEDNAKEIEEELEKEEKRMQEKREGKREMEVENAKEMEEEVERKLKRMQEIKKGKKKVEEEEEEEVEEEWEWEVEGQEVGLIKNQEAGDDTTTTTTTTTSTIIKKKSFVTKLVSKLSRKQRKKVPIVDDDPLTERLIMLELQRELRWRLRRIFGNGGNTAPRAFDFDKGLEALHSLKVHIFKDRVLPYYVTDYVTLKNLPEPSASLAELRKEFRTFMNRILSEEGGTDLSAHEHAFDLLTTIQRLQVSKSREQEYRRRHLQDSVPPLCGICQIPMTETVPFGEQIALDVPDEYAKV